jgi:hypothetical protein
MIYVIDMTDMTNMSVRLDRNDSYDRCDIRFRHYGTVPYSTETDVGTWIDREK